MRQGVRQQLAGMVVNRHLNIEREEFDHLKFLADELRPAWRREP